MKIAGYLFLMLLSMTSYAEESFWLGPGALSYHINRSVPHNEVNGGLAAEYAWTDIHGVGLGIYKNSIWRESHYLVYRYTPWKLGPVRLGAFVGAVDGYKINNGSIAPGGGLIAMLEGKRFGVNFIAEGNVFAVQLKMRLK